MMSEICPFCDIAEPVIENELAIARYDQYPVSPGHLLIVPRRHVQGYFELSVDEKRDLWNLVDHGKELIDEQRGPDGYNVGINYGSVAGQTVMHAHIHLIPRYRGDVDDPKGGVRSVIPEKQKYQTS
jgi:diadenosine tetraphosphate (Ap4A) HIT family hydrolase